MLAVEYARLSEDRKGLSENVNTQLEEDTEWIEDNHHTLYDKYWDNDISASAFSTKPRGDFDRMIEDIQTVDIELIVITEVARLVRKFEEGLLIVRLAETTSLRYVQVTNGTRYDLRTAHGVHDFMEAVNKAVLESRTTSDRAKRRRGKEAERGVSHGGPRPYGYEKGGLVINEIEAEWIRKCAALILGGETVLNVTRMLNERGVATAKGRIWHNRNLEQILTSRRIAGIRVHGEVEYPGTWPAIISVEDSDRLRLLLGNRRIPKNRQPKRYLLSGMIYCGLCKKRLISSGTIQKDGTLQRKYRCRHFDSSGNVYGCGRIVRAAEPVEVLVSEAVLFRCDAENVAASLRDASVPEVSQLMDEYNIRKLKLSNLIDDYASGLLNREQLAQAKAVVEEAIEQSRSKLAKLESGRVFASLPLDQTIEQAWEAGSLAWRRSLIALLVERIDIMPSWPGSKRWTAKDGRSWTFDENKILVTWRAYEAERPPERYHSPQASTVRRWPRLSFSATR